jgi:hypothetical protein
LTLLANISLFGDEATKKSAAIFLYQLVHREKDKSILKIIEKDEVEYEVTSQDGRGETTSMVLSNLITLKTTTNYCSAHSLKANILPAKPWLILEISIKCTKLTASI